MNPIEAFSVMSEHADIQHNYVVSRLGQDVVAASIEMKQLSEDAIVNLPDDEFKLYVNTPDDEPMPVDPYDNTSEEFYERAMELFGSVDGFGLTSADEHGLSINMMIHPPESILGFLRMTITAYGADIQIKKTLQIIGGPDAGITHPPVTPEDEMTAHKAIEKLKTVNDILNT